MRMNINQYIRHLKYILKVVFLEWPRGLDFTIPKANYYSVTPVGHIRDILSRFPISPQDNFLDVGCGKGQVLRYATEFPFGKIEGIEIDEELYEIAKRNMSKLCLEKRVEIAHCDALKFEKYSAYNCYFFYTPVVRLVLDKIVKSLDTNPRTVRILYYNHKFPELFAVTGRLRCEDEIFDYSKGLWTRIYVSI